MTHRTPAPTTPMFAAVQIMRPGPVRAADMDPTQPLANFHCPGMGVSELAGDEVKAEAFQRMSEAHAFAFGTLQDHAELHPLDASYVRDGETLHVMWREQDGDPRKELLEWITGDSTSVLQCEHLREAATKGWPSWVPAYRRSDGWWSPADNVIVSFQRPVLEYLASAMSAQRAMRNGNEASAERMVKRARKQAKLVERAG